MIRLDQFWGVDLVSWFPCVITIRVSFPLDEILQRLLSSLVSMTDYPLHFVFFLIVDEIRRGSIEVGTMSCRFVIGR